MERGTKATGPASINKFYVVISGSNNVSVIDGSNNTVIATTKILTPLLLGGVNITILFYLIHFQTR